MRNTRLALASTLLALATAACGGDGPALDGTFSNATVQERTLAIGTATGDPVLIGTFLILAADAAAIDPDGCVTRTDDGDTATFTGRPCQAAEGESAFAGTAVVHGWSDFEDFDADDQMTIEFDGFRFGEVADALVFNGTVEGSQSEDGRAEWIYSLSLQVGADTLELHATLACDPHPGTCRYVDAMGSTTATGEFAIEGTYRDGKGELTLIADQRMVVDFDATEGDCAPVTIDGQRVEDVCKPDDSEE